MKKEHRFMYDHFAAIGTMIALSGCASVPSAPIIQKVEVPIAIPCKAPIPQKPAFAVDSLPLGSGIWDQMKALREDRLERQGYEGELEAAVRACQ